MNVIKWHPIRQIIILNNRDNVNAHTPICTHRAFIISLDKEEIPSVYLSISFLSSTLDKNAGFIQGV